MRRMEGGAPRRQPQQSREQIQRDLQQSLEQNAQMPGDEFDEDGFEFDDTMDQALDALFDEQDSEDYESTQETQRPPAAGLAPADDALRPTAELPGFIPSAGVTSEMTTQGVVPENSGFAVEDTSAPAQVESLMNGYQPNAAEDAPTVEMQQPAARPRVESLMNSYQPNAAEDAPTEGMAVQDTVPFGERPTRELTTGELPTRKIPQPEGIATAETVELDGRIDPAIFDAPTQLLGDRVTADSPTQEFTPRAAEANDVTVEPDTVLLNENDRPTRELPARETAVQQYQRVNDIPSHVFERPTVEVGDPLPGDTSFRDNRNARRQDNARDRYVVNNVIDMGQTRMNNLRPEESAAMVGAAKEFVTKAADQAARRNVEQAADARVAAERAPYEAEANRLAERYFGMPVEQMGIDEIGQTNYEDVFDHPQIMSEADIRATAVLAEQLRQKAERFGMRDHASYFKEVFDTYLQATMRSERRAA